MSSINNFEEHFEKMFLYIEKLNAKKYYCVKIISSIYYNKTNIIKLNIKNLQCAGLFTSLIIMSFGDVLADIE